MIHSRPIKTQPKLFSGAAPLLAALMLFGCASKGAEPPPSETGAPAQAAEGGEQGQSCGSRGQAACAEDEFCDFPPSAACGDSDAPGVCTKVRPMCTREFAPVCGCDGKTYPTACTANAQKVSVRSTGPCPGDQGDAVEASSEAAP